MRAVVDTNVFVSALISLSGTPAAVLQRWREGAFVLVISAVLIEELERVTTYPHLQPLLKRSGAAVAGLVREIREKAIIVAPVSRITVSRDRDDNRLLEAAIAGRADAIVTGDRDLLELVGHDGVRILTPRGFLDEIDGR